MKRTKLIVSRILQIIPILLVVTILAFVLSNASAGDVATVTLQSRGMQITEESLAAIREELGLNAPIYLQYWNWLKNAVRFDFGNSFQTGRPVSEEILSRFPAIGAGCYANLTANVHSVGCTFCKIQGLCV